MFKIEICKKGLKIEEVHAIATFISFGVCSAFVLTGHGPSHELCWFQQAKHSLGEWWGGLRRHDYGDRSNSE
jgi:hypothetical protein